MPCALEQPGEPLFVKTSSSAFATSGLADWLRAEGITHVHVVGAVAMPGFDLPAAGLDAATIFDVTMGLLAADFATLTNSDAVIEALSSRG